MLKLQVVVGSTRSGRNADSVLRWFLPIARGHKDFETELLDLREWPLPMFQETIETVGDIHSPVYSVPLVKQWNDKIRSGDAFVFLTPEYNHGYPAVLKNAIDSVFFSFGFRHKPVAFVTYSAGIGGGVRCMTQLEQVMIETDSSPVRTGVMVPFVANAFTPEGKPVNPVLGVTAQVMLDDLAWMGRALKAARAEGELPPPNLRVRAAMAKLTAP
jgi:NAD(P)H-dependent FMN reductase